MRKTIAIAFIAALGFPAAAFATECGNVPQDQWMSEDALKTKAVASGYDVRQVKVEDGCYEIYAIDRDGKKVEAYLHPVTAAVVKIKVSD